MEGGRGRRMEEGGGGKGREVGVGRDTGESDGRHLRPNRFTSFPLPLLHHAPQTGEVLVR